MNPNFTNSILRPCRIPDGVKMSISTDRPDLKQLEAEISEKRRLEDILRDRIKRSQQEIERIYTQIDNLQEQQFHSSHIPDEDLGLLRQRRNLRELCEKTKRDKENLKRQLKEVLDQIESLQDRWKTSWRN